MQRHRYPLIAELVTDMSGGLSVAIHMRACTHLYVRMCVQHLNDSLVKPLGFLQVQEYHLWQVHPCFACFAVGHASFPDLLDQHLCLALGHILVSHPASGLEDSRHLWGIAHAWEVSLEVCLILQTTMHTKLFKETCAPHDSELCIKAAHFHVACLTVLSQFAAQAAVLSVLHSMIKGVKHNPTHHLCVL